MNRCLAQIARAMIFGFISSTAFAMAIGLVGSPYPPREHFKSLTSRPFMRWSVQRTIAWTRVEVCDARMLKPTPLIGPAVTAIPATFLERSFDYRSLRLCAEKLADGLVKLDSMSRTGSQPLRAIHVQAGWPMKSLSQTLWCDADSILKSNRSIVLSKRLGGTQGTIAIPLGIQIGGLVVNTLIWAAATSCAFGIWRYGARWYRSRRNECILCGYDLRNSMASRCPECGDKIPARKGATTD